MWSHLNVFKGGLIICEIDDNAIKPPLKTFFFYKQVTHMCLFLIGIYVLIFYGMVIMWHHIWKWTVRPCKTLSKAGIIVQLIHVLYLTLADCLLDGHSTLKIPTETKRWFNFILEIAQKDDSSILEIGNLKSLEKIIPKLS